MSEVYTTTISKHLKEHHISESNKIIEKSTDSLTEFREQISKFNKDLQVIAENNQTVKLQLGS